MLSIPAQLTIKTGSTYQSGEHMLPGAVVAAMWAHPTSTQS
jgi:hypothetical protein